MIQHTGNERVEKGREGLRSLREFRTEMYGMLAAAFLSPPTTEWLESLSEGNFLNVTDEVFGAELSGELRALLQSRTGLDELQGGLLREYEELFRIPGGKYVTPYESVFSDTFDAAGEPIRGLLSGQSVIDVKKWYRLARFEIPEDFLDLPDHIGLELRYLADLCAKESELEELGDTERVERAWEMERDFLAAHPRRWIDALARKVASKTQNPYYLYVTAVAQLFTARDLTTLEEVLGEASGSSAPDYAAVGS
ncbi:MAG TPA: hypothetical protein ENJ09_10860 [Planctomycetes bacterium]|nr:hypothetical protein [Planctomycetota bacterium]